MTAPTPVKPRLSIDPRIRQRRIEVRREEGRRRLRFLVGVVIVLLLAGAAAAATRSPLLDVDRVEVTGAAQTPSKDVLAAGRLHRGRLMIEIDSGAAARRIEGLRWVASARVERHWPSTVRVEIVERHAVAVVAVADGTWAPVDRHGRVLDAVAERPGLPLLLAVPPVGGDVRVTPRHARNALRVAAVMPGPLRARVAGVTSAGGGLELQLQGGGVVRLGPAADLPAKLDALGAVLERVPASAVAVIDVRVPDAPVLTRR